MTPQDTSLGFEPVTVPVLIDELNAKVCEAIKAKGMKSSEVELARPSGGQPAVRQLALPWAVLWPTIEQLMPAATHAVLAGLGQRFAPTIRPIIDRYDGQLRKLMDPADFAKLMSAINIFLPENLSAHVDPEIRPIFGSTFAPAE